MSNAQVTLAEAATQLDVHYMTAYRYVRTGRMIAEKRQGKWWVNADDLAAVLAEGTGPRRKPDSEQAVPREQLIEPFRERLIAGDTAGCWHLISAALAGGATPAEIHVRLLQGALCEIGAGWHRGELTVGQEHRATATAYRLLGQMGPLFRHRGRRRGTIVIGAAAGDHHALPTAIMSDLLCDRHFDVIDLGANTPTECFLEVAVEVDDLVGVGVCAVLDDVIEVALEQVRSIRAALPDVFLFAGGPAVANSDETQFAILADVVSTDAADVCAALDELLLGAAVGETVVGESSA